MAKENGKDVYLVPRTGKNIYRSYLEDSERPGHVREGLPLTNDEREAAMSWGFRWWNGRLVGGGGIIEPSRDPFLPKREEAPVELQKKLSEAKVKLDEVKKVMDEADLLE